MPTFLASPRPIASMKPWREGFHYSEEQLLRTAQVLGRAGFSIPVLLDGEGRVIAGYGQVEAARAMGLAEVPCADLDQMSEAGRRAYIFGQYKLALEAGWDEALLARELEGLFELGVSPAISLAILQREVAVLPTGLPAADANAGGEDVLLDLEDEIVTRPGDLWLLGPHRLVCGDASNPNAYAKLMGEDRAQMVFVDPLCDSRPSEAAARSSLAAYLTATFEQLSAHSREGAIHFIFAEWRQMRVVLEAGEAVYGELKDLIVWIRHDGEKRDLCPGHELVFVFQKSETEVESMHSDREWRPRGDIWRHQGIGRLHTDWTGDLVLQPTMKPVPLLTEAIEDCTEPGYIVLDAFCDTGTVLIAAEKTGRRARALEADPASCDMIIRRWQVFTGSEAVLAETGEGFEAVEQGRATVGQDGGRAFDATA